MVVTSLLGKIMDVAFRFPTIEVSMVVLTCYTSKEATDSVI